MPSLFIGVYIALYSYTAQTDKELTIQEGDLLYLLEKSQIDDWWLVKKHMVGNDVEEPSGIVPRTYIEPAQPVASARALYDYDKQTEEEISFTENDVFAVYDAEDPDWILVGLRGEEFGFVPSNYIEMGPVESGKNDSVVPTVEPQKVSATSVAQQYSQPQIAPLIAPPNSYQYEESPPPTPQRPRNPSPDSEPEPEPEPGIPQIPKRSATDSKFFSWDLQEVDGRKKKKCTLGVSDGYIWFSPAAFSSDDPNSAPQKWSAQDLIYYSPEKKHLFLDLQNPSRSFDLYCSSKDLATQIAQTLGEVRGAANAAGLKEVMLAANSGSLKSGRALYDFRAEGSDEVDLLENETVYILDDKKSSEWWMVRSSRTGQEGVVPSNYIEVIPSVGETSGKNGKNGKNGKILSRKSTRRNPRQEFDPESDSEIVETQAKEKSMRKRSMSILSRSKSRRNKEEKAKEKAKEKLRKDLPDSSKLRTWTDRSGTFKVDAQFLGYVDGKVHLHKENGVKIAVAAPKLCSADLEYVERQTGEDLSFARQKKGEKPRERERIREKERERNRAREIEREREREREREAENSRNYREKQAEKDPENDRQVSNTNSNQTNSQLQLQEPPAKPARPRPHYVSQSAPSYDWFEFFLSCGVDVNNCQRYTLNFEREQMDESVLPDITASVLRTLGLREGDILRVTRHLDEKYGRNGDRNGDRNGGSEGHSAPGGLFTGPGGELKNNRSGAGGAGGAGGAVSVSDASVDNKIVQKNEIAQKGPEVPPKPAPKFDDDGFEDDAWTVRPTAQAAGGAEAAAYDRSIRSEPQSPQPQPQEQRKPPTAPQSVNSQTQPNISADLMAPLQPAKTGGAGGAGGAANGNNTAKPPLLVPVATGAPLAPQTTGGVLVTPNGVLPAQKTGSGYLISMPTGGDPFRDPTPLVGQVTGGTLYAQPTGNVGSVVVGMPTGMPTGGFVTSGPSFQPQSQFGAAIIGQTPNMTGITPNMTGMMTNTTGIMPNTTGIMPNTTGIMPNTTGILPNTTGMIPNTTGPMPALTGMMQNMSLSGGNGVPTGLAMNGMGGINNGMVGMNNGINNGITGVSGMNFNNGNSGFQMNGMNSNIGMSGMSGMSNMPSGMSGMPMNTQPLGMPAFQGMAPQQTALQPQPTGFGFGSGSGFMPANPLAAGGPPPTSFGPPATSFGGSGELQTQPTGRRANLSNATPANPFGF